MVAKVPVEPPAGDRARRIGMMGIIALLVVATYGNTLGHGFVWDDTDLIVNNPLLESLRNIPRFFLLEDTIAGPSGYYRPLTYVSFALDRAVWGLNPLGFNLTNLALHLTVSLLFFVVLDDLFGKRRLAFAAAAIFSLHPLAGETVNFHAGGRNTLLCATFALLALLLYLRNRPLAAVAPFTLAIFSKEFALLLPLVFPVIDRYLRGERCRLERYLPFAAPVACYLALRAAAVQSPNFLATFQFSSRLLLTPYLVVRYLLNMVWPFHLKVLYDESTTTAVALVCLGTVALLVAAVVLLRRRTTELAFSGFWFLLFLLPVVNLVPLHSPTLIADRYAYFSLMGFALALAWLLSRLDRRASLAALVIIVAAFAATDIRQNRSWQNDATLFARATHDAPGMFLGYGVLARLDYESGNRAGARRNLEEACAMADVPPSFLREASAIFLEWGEPERAQGLLARAQVLQPDNAETYGMLATVRKALGDGRGAEAYREQGRRTVAGFDGKLEQLAKGFSGEGRKLLEKGASAAARKSLWRALAVQPDYVPTLVALGELAERTGDLPGAERYLKEALGREPSPETAPILERVKKLREGSGR